MSSEANWSSTDHSFVHVSEQRLGGSGCVGLVECGARVGKVIEQSSVEVINLNGVNTVHSSSNGSSDGSSEGAATTMNVT